MGTILLSSLIGQARPVAMDDGAVLRHGDEKFLAWANAGQRQAAIYKPDVCVANAALQLVPGTKQAIGAGGTVFVRLSHNMGSDGLVPGRAIVFKDFDRFSEANPYWHAADPSAEVRYCLFDARDPKVFYVYPPQPAAGCGWAQQVYGKAPDDIASVNDPIMIDDINANVLVDYMLFRLFKEDATINPFAPAKSQDHWNMFVSALGRMDLVEKQNGPAGQGKGGGDGR